MRAGLNDGHLKLTSKQKVYIKVHGDAKIVIKQRFTKTYRHSTLDERLNRTRTSQEARCLQKAFECGINTPRLLSWDKKNYLISMEFIEGPTVKAKIPQLAHDEDSALTLLATSIGESVASLHTQNLIHGDLTTSNMIINGLTGSLTIIDFGLASVSASIEDRAVDLYVLERALHSTHSEVAAKLFSLIIDSYGAAVNRSQETLARLAAVQLRGRKRDLSG